MKWCNVMNMWCSDIDNEDVENTGCDGCYNECEECEDVKPNIGVPVFRIFVCRRDKYCEFYESYWY